MKQSDEFNISNIAVSWFQIIQEADGIKIRIPPIVGRTLSNLDSAKLTPGRSQQRFFTIPEFKPNEQR